MTMVRISGSCLVVMAVLLASCGAGGGGGSQGSIDSGVAPTPTPTPAAPSPTPSPAATIQTLPPAPFGITVSQQFQPFGWQRRDTMIEALSPQLIDFRWSATARTYEMALPDIGRGRLEYAFPGSPNALAFRLVTDAGGVLPVDITLDDSRGFDPPYRSSGILLWESRAPAPPVSGEAVFGFPTSASALPRNGQVTYLAQGTADGDALVVFDFAAASFSGYVRLAWVDAWGPYSSTRYDFTQTSFVAGSSGFEARFTVPGAPFGGLVRGQFMGPNGEELAIAWRGPVQNPYTDAWEEHSGVWLARDCERCDIPG